MIFLFAFALKKSAFLAPPVTIKMIKEKPGHKEKRKRKKAI
jgi:hypothetical protein